MERSGESLGSDMAASVTSFYDQKLGRTASVSLDHLNGRYALRERRAQGQLSLSSPDLFEFNKHQCIVYI